jgi:ABC-type methionine transport system permease subunit
VKRIGVAMTNRRREAAIGSVDGSRSLPFIIRLAAVIPLTRLKHSEPILG